MQNDYLKASGRVEIVVIRADGTEEREEFDNLIVTAGKSHIAGRVSSAPPTGMGYIAIGTGATAPAAGDTTLQTELDRNSATAIANSNAVQFSSTWAPGDGTGALTEAGIFNAASAGTMLSRVTFPVKNKDAGDTFIINWTITFS